MSRSSMTPISPVSFQISLMRSIPPLDKQDLMRILDHIEDSLKVHWSDHEGFLTLQERVLQLRMILEESGDDVMHGAHIK